MDTNQAPDRLAQYLLEENKRLQQKIADLECAQSRLQHNEHNLIQTLEAISDHVYVTRITAQGDRHNVYLSPHVSILTGYRLQQFMVQWDFWQTLIVYPEDKVLANEQAQQAAYGYDGEIEYRIQRADGQIIWVRDSVRVYCDGADYLVYGVVSDITERKKVEQANLESEERLRTIIDNAIDAIIIANEDGLIESFNPAAERIFGYAAADIKGCNIAQLTPEPDRHHHPQYLANYLQTGQAHIIGSGREVMGQRADGSLVHLDLAVSEFKLHGQRMFMGIARDVSQQKQLEAQYRQAQKMEAVGQLAGGIAHDFNNILTIIAGQVELLLDRPNAFAPPEQQELILIQEASQRAITLTRQLLTFSRKQHVKPQTFNLSELIGSLQDMLQRLLDAPIQLTTNLTADPTYVHADPGQMEQVIVNLAVNARDAMPQGGKLLISSRVVLADSLTESPVHTPTYVELTVSDTGVGMDATTQARIFEPFFTTKSKDNGTGLGLSTVYGIIQQAQGHISVESEPGAGTTFQICLPYAKPVIHPPKKPEPPVPNSPATQATILLVEDEPGVRLITRRFLQKRGYTVLEATTAAEALQIQEECQHIDLLITDIALPEMDGHELVEHLRVSRPNLRVLYISGYAEKMFTQSGVIPTGANFLAKPFTAETLAQKVAQTLHQQVSQACS